MTTEVAAVLISILALVVSVAVAQRQHQLSIRTTAIEEARRSEEILNQKTANLVARPEHERHQEESFGKVQTKTDSYLVIQNIGAAPASDISTEIVDGTTPVRLDLSAFEGGYLETNESMRTYAFLVMGNAARFTLKLSWTDGRDRQEKSVPVRFS